MKAIKLSNGNTKLIISRDEWEKMGREAGWGDALKILLDPLVKNVNKAFQPEPTNPYIQKSEDGERGYQLTDQLEEQNILKTPSSSINIKQVEDKFNALQISDPDLLLAFKKGLDFINEASPVINPKTINGMKVLLFRIVNLKKESDNYKKFVEILKKWYREKIESDRLWEKPKNPYV